MCGFRGSQVSSTTAYRPQGNYENERAHNELHAYLAMYLTPATRKNWDLLLQHAAWVHNSTFHESNQTSPFEINTGLAPRVAKALLPNEIDASFDEFRDSTLRYYGLHKDKLKELRTLAQESIARSQDYTLERMNKHAKIPQVQSW